VSKRLVLFLATIGQALRLLVSPPPLPTPESLADGWTYVPRLDRHDRIHGLFTRVGKQLGLRSQVVRLNYMGFGNVKVFILEALIKELERIRPINVALATFKGPLGADREHFSDEVVRIDKCLDDLRDDLLKLRTTLFSDKAELATSSKTRGLA
jgi:hypothetical protein